MTDEKVGVSGATTYPDQDTLVLEVDIGDSELVGKRHDERRFYDSRTGLEDVRGR